MKQNQDIDLAQILTVATEAAEHAAELIRARRQAQQVSISLKARHNLVTTTDVEAEKAIIAHITSHFPDHRILAEESVQTVSPAEYGAGPVWVIDPIDGTTNFAHGHHQVGVSIAFAIDAQVQVGVVCAPFLGEIFTAIRGKGAFLNGTQIEATKTNGLENALVGTGFPYVRTNLPNICGRLERVLLRCRDVRRLGAASLDISFVACGRLDAFYEETLMPWDGAAGCLIAREAGAVVGHYPYDSETQQLTAKYPGDLFMDNVIVAAPGVFEELERVLQNET